MALKTFHLGDWHDDHKYTMAYGSGKATFDGDNSSVTDIYLVKYADHRAFIDELTGLNTFGTLGTNDSNLYRDIPNDHNLYSQMFCYYAGVEPMGFDETKRAADQPMMDTSGDDGWITPHFARITANYKAFSCDFIPDDEFANAPEYGRSTIVETVAGVETINATGKMIFCSGNKQALDAPPPIFTAVTNQTVTWLDIPADPNNKFVPANYYYIKQSLGRVNSTVFMGVEPVGTVLFLTYEAIPKKPNANNGSKLFDVVMHFQIKNNGLGINYYDGTKTIGTVQDPTNEFDYSGFQSYYNQFLGQNNRFDLMTVDGNKNSRKTYLTTDHNNLFKLKSS